MTTGQDIVPVPFCCPRCGGPMYKPAGSHFYWHATNNHPSCGITNLADVTESVSDPDHDDVESLTQQRKKPRF